MANSPNTRPQIPSLSPHHYTPTLTCARLILILKANSGSRSHSRSRLFSISSDVQQHYWPVAFLNNTYVYISI